MDFPRSCSTCTYFDEDCFCTLKHPSVITGFIREPKHVLCIMHAPKDDAPKEQK